MKGAPYETWFTPAEMSRFNEVARTEPGRQVLHAVTSALKRQIIEMALAGVRTKDIAMHLCLSVKAVQEHKVGVTRVPTYTAHNWYASRKRGWT